MLAAAEEEEDAAEGFGIVKMPDRRRKLDIKERQKTSLRGRYCRFPIMLSANRCELAAKCYVNDEADALFTAFLTVTTRQPR